MDVGEGTGARRAQTGHRAGRKAGALVVLVDGDLVLYVERGGKTLLSWTEDEHVLKEAATALSGAVSAGALGRMVVQKADGASVHESTPLSAALQAAGFAATPRVSACAVDPCVGSVVPAQGVPQRPEHEERSRSRIRSVSRGEGAASRRTAA